jgi:hypothetical protein
MPDVELVALQDSDAGLVARRAADRITKIDTWLVQQKKVPLDILIAICARASFCEWVFYGDANPAQKHRLIESLRACYAEFQKFPKRWQEALFPMMWGRWHAEFADEEAEEAARHA